VRGNQDGGFYLSWRAWEKLHDVGKAAGFLIKLMENGRF